MDGEDETGPRFKRWLDELSRREDEQHFSLWAVEGHRKLIRSFLGVGALFLVLFSVNDLLDVDPRVGFPALVAARLVFLLGLAATYYLIRKPVSPVFFRRALICLSLTLAALGFLTDLARPNDYFTHIGTDVTILYLVYLLVPIPVRYQVLVCVPFSVAVVALLFLYKEPIYTMVPISYTLSIVSANIFGFWISVRQGRLRRTNFTHLSGEQESRKQLQKALDEIKTLSDLIPICSGCKNIRDDEGYWSQVESYLGTRLDVAFTHGLCPACVARLYPGLTDDPE
ncbi:MAG: hypothetical protein QF689_02445 [Candidatus Latescibacteria bacterium]|jgi:hypothetical protein|nr:hypothetical protein [Gemmatimonadaceae bacterium]MDP6015775.1 hypothetical protein [Candidatus Latescibacterota bacterium]MDP7447425.1 hypothetical protein [Candidatus Latescibacterota bacterium]HJP31042.1 hypothetical protein [Candidatus Latescibacterota bacterium]|tara:strand:+ start:1058 stop:1909 length:852 start_codon:yes stop_codon:yes gene_type:complete